MLHTTLRSIAVVALLAAACGKQDDAPAKPAEPATEAPKAAPAGRMPMRTETPAQAAGEIATPAAEAPPSGLIPQLDALATKACNCKDKGCANAIQDEVAKIMGEGLAKVPQHETQAIGNAMQKMQACIAAAQAK